MKLVRSPQYLPMALAAALALFAVTFSRVAYDIVTANNDKLLVFCVVLAALSIIVSGLSIIAIWQNRSRNR
jgi:purine-cytosine permease-like protein